MDEVKGASTFAPLERDLKSHAALSCDPSQPLLVPSSGWLESAIPPLSGGKQTSCSRAEIDARDPFGRISRVGLGLRIVNCLG